MDLSGIRERVAQVLRGADIDAVCAWPAAALDRRSGPVVAISVRECRGGPGGFQDYLGERWNKSSGRWEELYGRKLELVLGLDLYAGRSTGETGIRTAFDQMAEAFHTPGVEGLRIIELSCGETKYDQNLGLFHCAVAAACEGYLYAVADEGGTFLDFIVRGDRAV